MTATTIGGVTPTNVLGAALNLALNPTSISSPIRLSIYGLVSATALRSNPTLRVLLQTGRWR